MENCLTKIRPSLLIEQYFKLFPTGYIVIVSTLYVTFNRDFLKKSRPGRLIEQVRLIEL